jgi:hypothetical protein
MLHFAGCLDTEDAAIVLAALEVITGKQATEQAEQPVDQPADEALPETSPRGRFDPPVPTPPSRPAALVGSAKAFLNSDRAPNRDPSTQLVVTIDAQVSERNARAGLAVYRAGGQLTSEQARRLACDTTLFTILKDGGEILDVGRATRTVPRGIRRALMARDRGCAMPGCNEHRTRKLHAHHIWHWADGGPTCLDNLTLTQDAFRGRLLRPSTAGKRSFVLLSVAGAGTRPTRIATEAKSEQSR